MKLLSSRVDAGRRFHDRGEEIDLPDDEALRCFRLGLAERLPQTETAALPPPQNAMLSRPQAAGSRRRKP